MNREKIVLNDQNNNYFPKEKEGLIISIDENFFKKA